MKKIFPVVIGMLIFTCLAACHRNNVDKLPAFNVLLTDSATVVNTGNIPAGEPTLLMYFSPECEHCHFTTQEMLRKIDSLKDVHIYMLTPMPFDELRGFSQYYHLDKYRNIMVGNDYQLTFYRTFKPSSIPYIAIYDKHKKLVKVYKKGAKVSDIIKTVIKES